jgi:threonylcarbamoyladenosine tRNA methylthiotransferase MtaB
MDYKGKKAAFYTLGCKLNFAETSSIAGDLIESGFERVSFEEKADIYMINTCSVTRQGDKASRNIIRQAYRRNPDAMIIVTGCYAQLKPEEAAHIEGVDLVLGNQEKFNAMDYLGDLHKKQPPGIWITPLPEITQYNKAFSLGERTRSFLKVQDGCDYYCSYCTIPYARGRSRNDSIENTIHEAHKAVNKGFKEIVLTGVNIGDFGKSTGEDFTTLLKELEKVKGIKRIRLGSIEPDLLKDEIIERTAESKIIMPHFHIPLQSGSDKVLTIMKRRYSVRLFAGRIDLIRKLIPDAFVGVDVIAGTNGETDQLFNESYNFIKNLNISQLHAFTYSERNGTQAIKIPNKVNPDERKRRTKMYINLSEKKKRAFYEKNIGSEHTVLFESKNKNGMITGFTDNYIKVETPFSEKLINEIKKVKLISVQPDNNMAINFK